MIHDCHPLFGICYVMFCGLMMLSAAGYKEYQLTLFLPLCIISVVGLVFSGLGLTIVTSDGD